MPDNDSSADLPALTGAGRRTPDEALAVLLAGNARFVSGALAHPGQDAHRRNELAEAQHPGALVLGCGDSRVPAEIVFDQGLGDLFVVRTAGHVVDVAVLGSIEFAVDVLGVPLVVVLGHDSCGAVAATKQAVETGVLPTGFIRDIVERVSPSVLAVRRSAEGAGEGLEREVEEHVRQTARLLVERSRILADAVEAGTCAVVGLTYALRDGEVRHVHSAGPLSELSG